MEALLAVSDFIEGGSIDRIVFVGDAVGYGAEPSEAIARVRSMACASVVGNHDYVASGREEPIYFNPVAREAILWTRDRLSEEERDYLGGLDLCAELKDFTIVHATPLNPLGWEYLFSGEEVMRNFDAFRERLCFIGHSHVPMVFCLDSKGNLEMEAPGRLSLKEGARYIINIGSVGQPRDNDPRACYVVYDSDKQSVDFIRVSYDITGAGEKIVKAGLPPYLARRLVQGI
jgi:diadenosine tetraphosphatase ApaH/serine/threonine PP2A family protein phosphatase